MSSGESVRGFSYSVTHTSENQIDEFKRTHRPRNVARELGLDAGTVAFQ